MITTEFRYAFGPVPSRRLGTSLGINNIPAKTCSYSCLYCQAGRTDLMRAQRTGFYEPAAIITEVASRLERADALGIRVDYVTFVPDGEPTLDSNLGETIGLLKSLGVRVAVITNGSLLWRPEVRADLASADFVSLKIDALRENTWHRINRPHGALRLDSVLDGILDFAAEFRGTITTETMLMAGINDSRGELEAIGGFLRQVHPSKAYLGLPTRPPSEGPAALTDEAGLNQAYQTLAGLYCPVEYLIGYEGNAFASTGDVERDILDITAVHPMRKEAILSLLERTSAPESTLDQLVRRGEISVTVYRGHTYYVRRLKSNVEVVR